MQLSLHTRIFIGMGIGLVVGLLLYSATDHETAFYQTSLWWLELFGKELFVGALKMIIAPLILMSIVAGVSSLPSASELGSVGGKTLAYYVTTTTIAVAIGVVAVLVVQPGKSESAQNIRAEREAELDALRTQYLAESGQPADGEVDPREFSRFIMVEEGREVSQGDFAGAWARMQAAEEGGIGEMLRTQIVRPILTNPFTSLAENPPNALGIIFFAILVGVACLALGETAAPVVRAFRAGNEIMMRITHWFMEVSPIAIGCLIAAIVADLGLDALRSLAWYCITVIGGIGVHVCVLLAIVYFVGGITPRRFVAGISKAWLVAFSTASSAATLPITLACVTEELEVDDKVADFTLPVGATVNMDGTALYEGVAVIFLIQIFGGLADAPLTLTLASTLVIFITAVFASVGAAAVPSAGLVTMAIVASAVGLPLYYIPLLFAVDRLLDMFRTSTNVMGDAAGAVVVNRLEQARLNRRPAISTAR